MEKFKLISWNCQGGFRNKAYRILKYHPDLTVISESEDLQHLKFPNGIKKPTQSLWFGDNPHKGLGVFAYADLKLEVLKRYNPAYKYVVPISVKTQEHEFLLFAIWANNREDKDGQYITQVWKALQEYNDLLDQVPIILAGDFNSNKIWDKPRRIGNHSDVVQELKEHRILSVYHEFFHEEQGAEKRPTFYLARKKTKPYHLDYCFASEKLLRQITTFRIGLYRYWIRDSDHMPLFLDLVR